MFRSLGNGVRKNGVRNRCPYRRCGVDTEFPYRLFSLILCCGESVESHWFWRHMGVDTEFPYRVPIVDRGTIAVPCLPTPFPILRMLGHTPSTAKFQKNSGKTPEMLSERFLEFPSRARLGSPKPYNRGIWVFQSISRILSPPVRLDASFFRSGSGEGLEELVMELPAALRVFLICGIALRPRVPAT